MSPAGALDAWAAQWVSQRRVHIAAEFESLPAAEQAEWVDRLRVKVQNLGLMRNTPRVKVGEVRESQVGDPPRYLHVPYPVGEAGDSKV